MPVDDKEKKKRLSQAAHLTTEYFEIGHELQESFMEDFDNCLSCADIFDSHYLNWNLLGSCDFSYLLSNGPEQDVDFEKMFDCEK